MQTEHYILIFLVVVIVLLFLFIRNRKRKHLRELSVLKADCERQLELQKTESDNYKNQVMQNLRETIPYGEQLLLKCFRKLFDDPAFSNYTIYSHLEFETERGYKQVDYFIVSPKGMFVVESKRWRGITYIYGNSFQNLFQNTTYDDFGMGSNIKVKVFNAQRNEDNSDKILLSAYQNPIKQAREYSRYLIGILEVKEVKNVIIFNVGEGYSVLYNNKPLSKVAVDNYTSIINDTCIKDFFTGLPDYDYNIERINNIIYSRYHYRFKLDKSSYQQEPISSI